MCGCSRSWPSDPLEESYLTVDGRESIQDFVDNTLLRTGGRTFLVTETGHHNGTAKECQGCSHSSGDNVPFAL